jgi:hypothetical protein
VGGVDSIATRVAVASADKAVVVESVDSVATRVAVVGADKAVAVAEWGGW